MSPNLLKENLIFLQFPAIPSPAVHQPHIDNIGQMIPMLSLK